MAQIRQQIEDISQDENIQKDIQVLPKNYNFEIPKTIWKIRTTNSCTVALQFPEGLLMYACTITDILTKYTDADVIIMGDVTYGACCVDDFTSRALGCDLLVHYGHSCLVPIQDTKGINLLYVFVQIDANLGHFIDTLRANFTAEQLLALVSTIQFVASLQVVKRTLESEGYRIVVPQSSPLSPGEVLGCTSPVISNDVSAIVYLGDGRFHLESVMIQNPKIPAFQYNPYSRILTAEKYGFELMIKARKEAINIAKNSVQFGLILGTLGRQGNMKIFKYLEEQLERSGKNVIKVLMSEIFGSKLDSFKNVDCWVQVACPRLSIDWGTTFSRPLLTPFELSVALGQMQLNDQEYPMDYYSFDSKGPWTNNHEQNRTIARPKRAHISLRNPAAKS